MGILARTIEHIPVKQKKIAALKARSWRGQRSNLEEYPRVGGITQMDESLYAVNALRWAREKRRLGWRGALRKMGMDKKTRARWERFQLEIPEKPYWLDRKKFIELYRDFQRNNDALEFLRHWKGSVHPPRPFRKVRLFIYRMYEDILANPAIKPMDKLTAFVFASNHNKAFDGLRANRIGTFNQLLEQELKTIQRKIASIRSEIQDDEKGKGK